MLKKALSLYVHIPFCEKKCRYCDFLSAPASLQNREQYVIDLCKSIKEQAEFYTEYEVITIFFGGGTPSILEGSQMRRILECIRSSFLVSTDAEITIEVNPGTVDLEKWKLYKKIGINRISIGLQSAQNEELELLGRIHTYETFLESYQQARSVGFDNINIDLISSLPGQTIKDYLKTLHTVLALKPEHISAYSLILEEHTALYQMFIDENGREKSVFWNEKEIRLLDEDTDREIYHLTKKVLEEAGYERYEISNYAQKGKECRHNKVYWERGEYLGLGAGAASLVGKERFKNENTYPFSHIEREQLGKKEEMEEYMFLGLRMMKGVSEKQFEDNFQCSMKEVYGEIIRKFQEEGMMEERWMDQEKRIVLTEKGLDVSNYIMSEFLL